MDGNSTNNPLKRFAYLLEPIRDLQKNWDLDIAHVLEQFSEELLKEAGIQQQQQEQQQLFNFAEAAMLIQGAAGVYGRKVEYLYNLVIQVRNMLSKRTKHKEKEPNENGDNQPDADSEKPNLDDPDAFLTFPKRRTAPKGLLLPPGDTSVANPLQQPLIPMALIPLVDFEKDDVPLFANNGDLLGKKDDFRVNSCYLHRIGTLLLDAVHSSLVDDTLDDGGGKGWTLEQQTEDTGTDEQLEGDVDQGRQDEDYITPVEVQRDGTSTVEPRTLRSSVSILAVEERRRKDRLTAVTNASNDENKDPFRLLDPFELSVGKRPFKIGRPFRFPETIRKMQQRKRKIGNRLNDGNECDDRLESVINYIDSQFFTNNNKMTGRKMWQIDDCPALDNCFYQEYKRRLSVKLGRFQQPTTVGNENDQAQAVQDSDGNSNCDTDDDDDDDDDDARAEPLDEEDLATQLNEKQLLGCIPEQLAKEVFDSHEDERQFQDLGYEDQVRHYVNRVATSTLKHTNMSPLTSRVDAWKVLLNEAQLDQSSRRSFQLDVYESELLALFNSVGAKLCFPLVVTGRPHWDRCRYLLTSLILVNRMVVHLDNDSCRRLSFGMDQTVDGLTFTLLDDRNLKEPFVPVDTDH